MGTAYVDCIRDGTVFKTYDFEFGGPVRPDFLPEPQKLVGTAMTNLINDRLALPPYAKIRFAGVTVTLRTGRPLKATCPDE